MQATSFSFVSQIERRISPSYVMSFLDNSWTVVKRQNVHVRDKKAAENIKFTGHGIKELEYRWVVAANTFFAHGGGAEQV